MSDLISPIDPSKPHYTGNKILLLENYIDEATCKEWVDFAAKKAGIPAPVGKNESEGAVTNITNKGFIADRINIIFAPKIKAAAKKLFHYMYNHHVKEHYDADIEYFELPHMLRYSSGGYYDFHSDSETWNKKSKQWIKGIDRDYSCIAYLNSEYTGGALVFPDLNLKLQPKTGLVVLFPSNHEFIHSAEETLSGKRYIMVTWAAERGVAKILSQPPPQSIFIED